MDIGEKIKKIRIKKGLTRQQLAAELHVSDSTISRYENNKRVPNIQMLAKIASLFNIDISSLTSDDSFDSEIFDTALFYSMGKTDTGKELELLGKYANYDTLLEFNENKIKNLPNDCLKGLLKFICFESQKDFKRIYKDLIETEVYAISNELREFCDNLYLQCLNPINYINKEYEENIKHKLSKNNTEFSELLKPIEALIKFLLEDGYPVSKLDNKILGYLYSKITDTLQFEFYKLEKNNYKLPSEKNSD